MSVKSSFIQTSLFDVLQESIATIECISNNGIETYPIMQNVMQSVFLQSTGYSEQKLRLIDWEVASMDLEYRYHLLQGQISYGEFSKYEDKKQMFELLTRKFQENCSDAKSYLLDKTYRTEILKQVKQEMSIIFDKSFVKNSMNSAYNDYGNDIKKWKIDNFAEGKTLLSGLLAERYEALYRMRNRVAHNSLSYQQDSASFADFKNQKMAGNNYFTYFALLLLLDKVFVLSYDVLCESYRIKC